MTDDLQVDWVGGKDGSINQNIYQRLNWVRDKVAYIKKDADIDGRYLAVSHDAVTRAVRSHMIEAGVIVVPALVSGKTVQDTGMATRRGTPIIRYEAVYEVTFINIDTPSDTCTFVVEAHATDEGDKAPGKALSYAVKSALLKILMLETGEEDEERVEAEPQKLTEEHKLALVEKCRSLGFDPQEALEALAVKVYRLEKIGDIPDAMFDDAVVRLERRGSKAAKAQELRDAIGPRDE